MFNFIFKVYCLIPYEKARTPSKRVPRKKKLIPSNKNNNINIPDLTGILQQQNLENQAEKLIQRLDDDVDNGTEVRHRRSHTAKNQSDLHTVDVLRNSESLPPLGGHLLYNIDNYRENQNTDEVIKSKLADKMRDDEFPADIITVMDNNADEKKDVDQYFPPTSYSHPPAYHSLGNESTDSPAQEVAGSRSSSLGSNRLLVSVETNDSLVGDNVINLVGSDGGSDSSHVATTKL